MQLTQISLSISFLPPIFLSHLSSLCLLSLPSLPLSDPFPPTTDLIHTLTHHSRPHQNPGLHHSSQPHQIHQPRPLPPAGAPLTATASTSSAMSSTSLWPSASSDPSSHVLDLNGDRRGEHVHGGVGGAQVGSARGVSVCDWRWWVGVWMRSVVPIWKNGEVWKENREFWGRRAGGYGRRGGEGGEGEVAEGGDVREKKEGGGKRKKEGDKSDMCVNGGGNYIISNGGDNINRKNRQN